MVDIPVNDIYDFGLFLIDQDLRQHGVSLSSFPSTSGKPKISLIVLDTLSSLNEAINTS